MKNTLILSLTFALTLFLACTSVRAQKPSTSGPAPKPLAPVSVASVTQGPDTVTLDRADTLELSLSLAEVTIAEKELAILRLQARELDRKLADARDAASNAKVAYNDKARAKFTAAGIPADQLDQYTGTQDSTGRLVMKRTNASVPTK